jgi:mono/diheme cytochrome c family protein
MRRVLAIAVLLAACDDQLFDAPQMLGGVRVDAQTLNLGHASYKAYCAPCHGKKGDGLGSMGRRQSPPPRDLRLGIIKYASVPAGSVPRDDDVIRVLERGLRGRPMLAWPLPKKELAAINNYTKTLSERRRKEVPPDPITISADPWNTPSEAVARGRELYHGRAKCVRCHPAYLPEEQAQQRARAAGLKPDDWGRSRLGLSASRPSAYGFDIVAPDLAKDTICSGTTPTDYFRVIAAGVGGTGMDALQGVLPDGDLWAIAHYVGHVVAHGGDR